VPPKKKPEAEAANESVPTSAAPVLPTDHGKGRVFLIDAYSFIFRAYHAMARQRPMSTKTGVPTSATYVFVNMLNKLRKDFAPELIAAVFDVGGSFRTAQAAAMPALKKRDKDSGEIVEVEYAGYKANRSEMPEDLRQQVPYIRRALDAYRIPILSAEGFEADDVIGTLAKKASDAKYAVYVVSSDKDMLQLVNDGVCVLNPPKDNLICDRAKVEEILGVPPERVIDVMALRGDSIDNVPGAPGIGDKGSVELIQRFGSLDNLLEHAAEVEKKTYRESLQNNQEMIRLSKELVTIQMSVPIEFDPDSMRAQPPDAAAARALFSELEFTTLVKEFMSEGVSVKDVSYGTLTAADVKGLAKQSSLAIAFDSAARPKVETEEEPEAPQMQMSLQAEPDAEVGGGHIGLSAKPNEAFETELKSDLRTEIRALLENPKITKSAHDLKGAVRNLGREGIDLSNAVHDPMLYAYLLDPTYTSYALADLALRHLDLKLSGSLTEAADVTGRLAADLRQQVDAAELTKVYDEIDLPLVPVLTRMEDSGVKLDCDVLAEMSQRLQVDTTALARRIHEMAGQTFNINSPKQLGDVLFNKMNLPKPVKYGKGKTISTAVDVLEGLATDHEIARLVLEFRQLTKLKSTYIDSLPLLCKPGTGRVHTSFNQAATATGRLSSTNPNLQNIPIRSEIGREIRAAFVAEKGNVLLKADYSQIELRLLAHYSEDPLLIDAYRTGQDIHTLTAAQVFGVPPMMIDAEHRRRAKAVNFGIVYGLSPFGLSQQLGIEQRVAKKFIEAYFEKYAGVTKFIERTLAQARIEGKVRTLFGRVRPIPDIQSKNPNMRGFAERTAVNTPLQGTAADLIKVAMITIDRELTKTKLKSRMLLQVHDELVFEVPQDEVELMRELVKRNMESAIELRVPLVVDVGVGMNWRDAK
jgi:DNA polymerase I